MTVVGAPYVGFQWLIEPASAGLAVDGSASNVVPEVFNLCSPTYTLPGQKVAPCETEAGEEAINGNCWVQMVKVKPPCGRLTFRHEDACYRPVAEPKKLTP